MIAMSVFSNQRCHYYIYTHGELSVNLHSLCTHCEKEATENPSKVKRDDPYLAQT